MDWGWTVEQRLVLMVCGGMQLPDDGGNGLAVLAKEIAQTLPIQLVMAPQPALGGLSPFALRQVLEAAIAPAAVPPPLLLWAFSAGGVGAAGLAVHWQRWRGPVAALCLLDGWGVPAPPGVPVHRLSHDRFTHDSSRLLGRGTIDFYANPAVPHLHLWHCPQAVTGWVVGGDRQEATRTTAAAFLRERSQAACDRLSAVDAPLNINGP